MPEVDSYFEPDGDRVVPTGHAAGHWSTGRIGGRPVLGLSAWAFEGCLPDGSWLPARLTLDMVHMGDMSPIALTHRVRRSGRTVMVVDIEFAQADRVIALVRGVATRAAVAPSGQRWSSASAMGDPPHDELARPGEYPFAIATGRASYGGLGPVPCRAGVSALSLPHRGAPLAWVKEYLPVMAGEALTPYTRLGMGADVANSVLNWGTDGLRLINPDVTMSIARLPEGAALGLEAVAYACEAGTSVGTVGLHDETGGFGQVSMTAVHQPVFGGIGTSAPAGEASLS